MDVAIDLEAAAARLGVHYQTAYRWVRSGVLPARKVGGEYRLSVSDVDRLAALRCNRGPLGYTGRPRDWGRLRTQLHASPGDGDESAARPVVEPVRLAAGPLLDHR